MSTTYPFEPVFPVYHKRSAFIRQSAQKSKLAIKAKEQILQVISRNVRANVRDELMRKHLGPARNRTNRIQASLHFKKKKMRLIVLIKLSLYKKKM